MKCVYTMRNNQITSTDSTEWQDLHMEVRFLGVWKNPVSHVGFWTMNGEAPTPTDWSLEVP